MNEVQGSTVGAGGGEGIDAPGSAAAWAARWSGVLGPVTVSVPATSANLGPGFDTLGLALDLTDEVSAEVIDQGFAGSDQRFIAVVDISGEGAGEVPGDASHLVIATMLTAFDRLGVAAPPGLRLTCVNRIPHARGLGSSSAAIVAGILLARALAGRAADDHQEASLALAAELEGHPDNVAPCLYGGFTIAWTDQAGTDYSGTDQSDRAGAARLTPDERVHPVVYVPVLRGLTAHARAALPAEVPHRDAVFNVARTALLVHALTTDPGLLMRATDDRLHQPYRAPSMPETAQLVADLRAAGVPAVVSGAGPSVLAFTGSFAGTPPHPPAGWTALPVSISAAGARIMENRHAEGDPVAAGRLG
jgi:homoserine kinase